ncbi:MAG: CotH kinase family protein [Candidatus Omnitrophota bacterium]
MKLVYVFTMALLLVNVLPSSGDIVITEIMYHPQSDIDEQEYVELYNSGEQSIVLTNYAFTGGISFAFPKTASIAAKGYLVVAKDAEIIRTLYKIENVVGNYSGKLSNSGEQIVLEDSLGRIVDQVEYGEAAPWPVQADGEGPSLELIDPTKDNNDPFNWRSSELPPAGLPWGTPGRENGTYSADLPPKIGNIRHKPDAPLKGETISLRADVADETGVRNVWAEFMATRIFAVDSDPLPVPEGEWLTLALYDNGTHGDRTPYDGSFEADLPAFPAGVLVRYRIHAQDMLSQEGIGPDPNLFPRQLALYVRGEELNAEIPVFSIVIVADDLAALKENAAKPPSDADYDKTKRATFIDSNGLAYDDVKMRFLGYPEERIQAKPGWRIEFNDGYLFEGRAKMNLDSLFHPNNTSRRGDAGLYESVAWEVFRRAGVASIRTQTVRLNLNGASQGVFLERENVEEDFLDRLGKDRDSNLYQSQGDPTRAYPGTRGDESVLKSLDEYKITYNNRTNNDASYDDLIAFIEALNADSGDALAAFWGQSFAGSLFLRYLAAGAVCVDIDRVWRNHFLYRDQNSDLWEIIPERLDRTFEIADADILMDAEGHSSPFGPWPLFSQFLSLAENESLYEEKIRELLMHTFNERVLYPVVDRYVMQIQDEADKDRDHWGSATGYKNLEVHALALKQFIRQRRQNLIAQLPQQLLVSNAYVSPAVPNSLQSIEFHVDVLSAAPLLDVTLHYANDAGADALQMPMFALDDGTDYSTEIHAQPSGTPIFYFITGTFSDGTSFRYPESPSTSLRVDIMDSPESVASHIAVNEIMYNSPVGDNEWIELYNRGPETIDLSGWTYKDDSDDNAFVLPDGAVLAADDYLVLTKDSSLLAYLYGLPNAISGVAFNLGNGGDSARIFSRSGSLVSRVDFDDDSPWPVEADGAGPSLELYSPDLIANSPVNWRSSNASAPQGTPGARNSVTPPPAGVGDWALY